MAQLKLDTNSYTKGLDAERYGLEYLVKNGHKHIASRYHCPHGEIDIITTYGTSLYFIEVKSRSNLESAILSIDRKKMLKINSAIDYFFTYNESYKKYNPCLSLIALETKVEKRGKHVKNIQFFPSIELY